MRRPPTPATHHSLRGGAMSIPLRRRTPRSRPRALVAVALSAMLVSTACAARFEPPEPGVLGAPATSDGGDGLVIDDTTGEVVVDPGASLAPTPTSSGGAVIPGMPTSGPSRGATASPRPGTTTAPRPGSTTGPTSSSTAPSSSVDPGRKTGITATTIKIAYLIPKTGAAPVPPQVEQGIRAYWEYLKTKGGIAGRNVEVSVYDTTSNEQVAREVAQQALDDGNFTVVALDRLGVQQAIGKFLDDRQVPNLMVQTPVNLPTSQRWTFGLTIDHDSQGTMIADYFKRALKAEKVAVVYETDNTLKPGVEAFKAEAKKVGLQVVYETQIDGNGNDFSAQASSLRTSGATATWLYMAPIPAAKLTNQSDAIGYHPTWFANSISWNFDIVYGKGANQSLRGARAFSPWPALSDPRAATYRAAYQRIYADPPEDLGIPGWGIGQIISAALKQVGVDLGQNNFRAAMQTLQTGATSSIDGTPMLWSPLRFGTGVRTGATEVITFKEQNLAWTGEADYRSSY
ncbi:MAG TPA: ABC transporter substrate-binding protein [Mycobacteriales bacterium]|nr:ABC transporter substrate-binding protein [Mycobacteriales bacterium]